MGRCPFAVWEPVNGGLGAYSGGPFKIVHHTTEGSSYAGALAAYKAKKSEPHFTVDGSKIYQHVDTDEVSRSLRNPPGGVETNRDSAVQIELVGEAGKPKNPAALANVASLCRWIEAQHGVPQQWPNGHPRYSSNGQDPGGHNRNAQTWDTVGGHYGHSQVPENTHWDPGYTPGEVLIVTPLGLALPASESVMALPEWSLQRGEGVAAPGADAVASLQAGLREQLADAVRLLSEAGPGGRWFPGGITELAVSLEVGQLGSASIRIAGPATSARRSRAGTVSLEERP